MRGDCFAAPRLAMTFEERGPGDTALVFEDLFVVHPVFVFPGLVFAGGMRR
jgi:hypothetical protein